MKKGSIISVGKNEFTAVEPHLCISHAHTQFKAVEPLLAALDVLHQRLYHVSSHVGGGGGGYLVSPSSDSSHTCNSCTLGTVTSHLQVCLFNKSGVMQWNVISVKRNIAGTVIEFSEFIHCYLSIFGSQKVVRCRGIGISYSIIICEQ